MGGGGGEGWPVWEHFIQDPFVYSTSKTLIQVNRNYCYNTVWSYNVRFVKDFRAYNKHYKTGRICVRMFLRIQKSPREIIQFFVLPSNSQRENINTEQRQHQWREIKQHRGRDLTVVLKESEIIQKCFLPREARNYECHSLLQCACDSLHDWLSPITRQENITCRKWPMTGGELVYSTP